MKVSRFFVSGFIAIILITVFTVVSHAALIDNGDGTITDTDRNLMWLQDANVNGAMNWSGATAWAATLEFAGYSDWRLPFADPECGLASNCINSEMGHIFYIELGNVEPFIDCKLGFNCGLQYSDPFTNIQTVTHAYWTGTGVYNDGYPSDAAWHFNFTDGEQDNGAITGDNYAMAVRVVPEPTSSILFIVGGGALGFRHFRKKFKK